MTPLRRTKELRRMLALALLFLVGSEGAQAQDRPPEIVAIVNRGNPMPSISVHELRLLYALYKRSWTGGIRVYLIIPAPGSAAMEFLVSSVFRHRNEQQIDTFYLQAVFAQSIPLRPPQLPARAAIELVRSEPGAIALVERREIRDGAGVRVLQISDD